MKELEKIFKTPLPAQNAPDVFFNQLDKTWMHDKINENGLTFSIYPSEINGGVEDDGSVEYKINRQYFRSDDFKQNHENKKHILFAGCSETEGVGSPSDTVWAKVLYDKISEKEELSGYFNIGRAGAGWEKIISLFLIYEKDYGTPDELYIILPNLCRFYEWTEEGYDHGFKYVQRSWHDGLVTEGRYREELIRFLMGWKLFERYCESKNIKLIWGTWEHLDNWHYKNIGVFNHFVELPANENANETDAFKKLIQEKRPTGKMLKYDLRRRDNHHGVLVHEFWASIFLENREK